MRWQVLATVLIGLTAALAWAGAPVNAQDQTGTPQPQSSQAAPQPPLPALPPAPDGQPVLDAAAPAPEASPPSITENAPAPAGPASSLAAEPVPADPVVSIIRAKLSDPAFGKEHAGDVAALASFYAARTGGPLWMTEMGLSAKGQQVLFEIEKAGEWGLNAASFELPSADALPATPEAQALAEIKLDLAILKYARFARGGRLTPSEVSSLFDQQPPLRAPEEVLAEIEVAEAPDDYLRSLHPKHEQFVRLRQALLAARDKAGDEGKPAAMSKDVKRILINMERWRWMPEDLGDTHVIVNSASFMLHVIKDNKTIYTDKTLVGTIGYATPVFTSPMKTIVFNPEWVAPETVVKENILPMLQAKRYSILKKHKLHVSYNGQPVDATKIDWNRVNGETYTFSQKAGSHNNLGKVKFLYPNRHTVYMHDTLPVRKKYFKKAKRMIGHECVRMEKPDRFAEVLLAESNGVSKERVKDLWDSGVNSAVALERQFPVHMVYFTAVVGESGKVETFADVYGLDRKLALALFGDTTGFPQPPPEPPKREISESEARPVNRSAGRSDIMRSMQGFFGN
jgi:murein L,D-transpeptidase YcbB/YkuD